MFPDSGPTVAGTVLRPSLWVMVPAVGILAATSGLVVVTGAVASRRRVVPIVPASDEVGVAETDLAPVGTVHLRGESWSGRAIAGTIPRGAGVRVTGRDGLTILVTLVDGTPRDASPAPDGMGVRGGG